MTRDALPGDARPAPFLLPARGVVVPPRHFDCPHYGACLLHAVRRGWRSWTCLGCPHAPPGLRPELLDRGGRRRRR